MHDLVDGAQCLCAACIRERNEQNDALHGDIYNAFRAKLFNTSSRPPQCTCSWCNRLGVNGLEGCLTPHDPNYERIEGRAASLLREMLSDPQWECWVENDYFPVVSNHGNVFRVYRMPTYNTLQVQTGDWLCTLPRTSRWGGEGVVVPPSDGRVAQMLTILTDEDRFIRTANRHDRCQHPSGWKPSDLNPQEKGQPQVRRYLRTANLG